MFLFLNLILKFGLRNFTATCGCHLVFFFTEHTSFAENALTVTGRCCLRRSHVTSRSPRNICPATRPTTTCSFLRLLFLLPSSPLPPPFLPPAFPSVPPDPHGASTIRAARSPVAAAPPRPSSRRAARSRPRCVSRGSVLLPCWMRAGGLWRIRAIGAGIGFERGGDEGRLAGKRCFSLHFSGIRWKSHGLSL